VGGLDLSRALPAKKGGQQMTSTISVRPICFRVTALSPTKKRPLLIILLLLAAVSVYTADLEADPPKCICHAHTCIRDAVFDVEL
jgi:hypothetical protein